MRERECVCVYERESENFFDVRNFFMFTKSILTLLQTFFSAFAVCM